MAQLTLYTVLASICIYYNFTYCLFEAETFQNQTDVYFWIQTVLLYCPLMYFAGYVTCKVTLRLYPRIKCICNNAPNTSTNSLNDLLNYQEFPARMEDNDVDDDDDDDYATNNASVAVQPIPDHEQ